MQQPLISLIICTYNNADSLALTLQQLHDQIIAQKKAFEIILVDNNSPDHTKNICTTFIEKSGINTTYFFEGRQGLSHARNTGVSAAKGEYILFTDDDAELPTNWLSTYLKTIEQLQPDCLYSRIQVIWSQPKPWWYISAYNPCFVELDYGDKLLEITDIHKEFYGKNFCVKKQLILDQGGFDPALGRIGSKLIAGEETLLYRNLVNSKRKVIYFPDASVGHRLKPKEYTEAHIKKLFTDGAYSAMHIARVTAHKKIMGRPLGILLSSTKIFFVSLGLFLTHAIAGNKQKSFYNKLRMSKAITIIRLWFLPV